MSPMIIDEVKDFDLDKLPKVELPPGAVICIGTPQRLTVRQILDEATTLYVPFSIWLDDSNITAFQQALNQRLERAGIRPEDPLRDDCQNRVLQRFVQDSVSEVLNA